MMDKTKDEEIYWNINKTLSHGCLFNFILSLRGGGKSVAVLKYCINKYLKEKKKGNKWQFVYVRRHENELKKLTTQRGGRIFDDVARFFPDHKLTAESNTLYCDKDIMGYAIQLSNAGSQKSDAFPHVRFIIFEEFVALNRQTYLQDEVIKFLELYETIARPGTSHPDVPIFFLGNSVQETNPYFEYFNLEKPYAGEFKKFGETKDILVQNVELPKLREQKRKSRFGKIISDTNYEKYSVDNEWLKNNDVEFIKKKSANAEFRMALRYNGQWIGIWFDDVEWLYYVSYSCNLQTKNKYAVTLDDHQPNVMMAKTAKNMNSFKHLTEFYLNGAIRYENTKLQTIFRDIMRIINYC